MIEHLSGHLSVSQGPVTTLRDETNLGGIVDTPSRWDAIQRVLINMENSVERNLTKFNKGEEEDFHFGRNNPMH